MRSPTAGGLCVKGRFGYDFIYSEDRLTTPLIKEKGEFRQASWDEALDLVADRFKAIIAESGPDALAGVSCARSINEDSYKMQKLFGRFSKPITSTIAPVLDMLPRSPVWRQVSGQAP